jgi:hypothetical protein
MKNRPIRKSAVVVVFDEFQQLVVGRRKHWRSFNIRIMTEEILLTAVIARPRSLSRCAN